MIDEWESTTRFDGEQEQAGVTEVNFGCGRFIGSSVRALQSKVGLVWASFVICWTVDTSVIEQRMSHILSLNINISQPTISTGSRRLRLAGTSFYSPTNRRIGLASTE